ncbi:MAG: DUF4268 domain-containing protein [Planctomycetes bacterium]|nr:DUF4268 domain-containing protein [Planctomycetota bacterium]
MVVYELTNSSIQTLEPVSFSDVGLEERSDLQRLLRKQIEVISPETLVIAEEFGEWEESKRRIDLLGVDKDANLVVVELKRTDDGGHMELQAIRYAAMVSTMTFDQAAEVFASYLSKQNRTEEARDTLLEFLGWEEPDEDNFAQDVRIVLVSADFSKELTTAVMWLNERTMDIRCIRMQPYRDGLRVLVDVQQVIPLPEAEDYQVRLRNKEAISRIDRRGKTETQKQLHEFWTQLLDMAREKTPLHQNISPGWDSWAGATAGVGGLSFNYCFGRHINRVELYINRGTAEENKRIYGKLSEQKETIEERYGGKLEWKPLPGKKTCRILAEIPEGGFDDPANWPRIQKAMVDTMIRFEAALRPSLDSLT